MQDFLVLQRFHGIVCKHPSWCKYVHTSSESSAKVHTPRFGLVAAFFFLTSACFFDGLQTDFLRGDDNSAVYRLNGAPDWLMKINWLHIITFLHPDEIQILPLSEQALNSARTIGILSVRYLRGSAWKKLERSLNNFGNRF